MSNANWAYGSTLTSPAGVIAELDTLGVFAPRAETIEVTTHTSAGGYKEFLGGLRDGGELTFSGNFYPGNAPQIAMQTYLEDGVLRPFTITLPVAMAATITLEGIVTGVDIGAFPVGGKVAFGGTIKISGKPLVNVTASNNITALTGTEQFGLAPPEPLDFVPNFLAATRAYSCDGVDTASTWVKFTATFAAGVCTVWIAGVLVATLTTIVESGPITIGAANTMTAITLRVKETNKVAVEYVINVPRP